MAVNLKQILRDKAPIKAISLILGYAFFNMLSQNQNVTHYFDVPVCFYGKAAGHVVAPEHITVALRAKKQDLRTLDAHNLAAHINSTQLHDGPNHVPLTAAHLFLPDFIKLVHYNPSNIIITVNTDMTSATA